MRAKHFDEVEWALKELGFFGCTVFSDQLPVWFQAQPMAVPTDMTAIIHGDNTPNTKNKVKGSDCELDESGELSTSRRDSVMFDYRRQP